MLNPTTRMLAFGLGLGVGLLHCRPALAEDPCARAPKAPAVVHADMVTITWTGQILSPMGDRIQAEFDAAKERVRSVVLVLSSCGGNLREAEKVIDALTGIKKTHHLETRVDRGSMCGSACIPIFLQGQRRRAALTSTWLFHEVTRRSASDKSKRGVDRAGTERLFQEYFETAGVSEPWLNQLRIMVQHSDYWQTGENLWESKSGIITDPIDNHVPRRTERLKY